MGRVQTADLPALSALWSRKRAGDFMDCYSADATLAPRQAAQLALTLPAWVRALMRLRNLMVAPLGLRTGAPNGPDVIGIFPVLSETADEIILGGDDRHLDFRITILRQPGKIYGATLVHCHNRLGRAYLALVMPFHIIIMRNAMGRLRDH